MAVVEVGYAQHLSLWSMEGLPDPPYMPRFRTTVQSGPCGNMSRVHCFISLLLLDASPSGRIDKEQPIKRDGMPVDDRYTVLKMRNS
jgi:hypothetical protein